MKVQWLQRMVQSFRGTASREDWWVSMLGVLVAVLIVYFGKILFDDVLPALKHWTTAALIGICAIAWMPVSIRRLRDLGMSPWWVVIGLIPIANLGLFVLLGTRKAACATPIAASAPRGERGPCAAAETYSPGRRGAAGRTAADERN